MPNPDLKEVVERVEKALAAAEGAWIGSISIGDAQLKFADVGALLAYKREVEEALTFYAAPENWKSPSTGFALQYDPKPSPIRLDQGSRARRLVEGGEA